MVIIPLHMHLTLSNWWLVLWSRDSFIKSLKGTGGTVDVQFRLKAVKSHQSQ